MNVHISYKISKTSDLEKQIHQQIEKLGRHLRVFRPELVRLKGGVEEAAGRVGIAVSLNLRLPSGQMAAQGNSSTATAAVKAAFEALTEQLKRHKELLRNYHKWPRRRGPERAAVATVPFADTIAVLKPEPISAEDIAGYVNVNLPRLQRFIQRELDYRESQGQLQAGQIAQEDVVAEAIGNALSEQHDIPERTKLEAWVHRLARKAIDELSLENREDGHVSLDRSHGQQNVQASDENSLQFHQPDEQLLEENMIPDPTANNPEELAARGELISLVETALRGAGRDDAEAFILFSIEGFTAEEISDITNRSGEEVRASIRKAREHLQRVLPVKHPLKEKLVHYSQSA